jgi:hypothetical protein
MKPQTKQIIQGLLFAVGVTFILILWDIFSEKLPQNILDQMDDMILYGTIGVASLMGIGAVIFIYHNLFSEIYTQSIMHRANDLLDISITSGEKYLYIITNCLQSGDDASQSYFIYVYYLFEIKTGKKIKYRSKKPQREDEQALEYFKNQLKENVAIRFKPDKVSEKKIEQGNYVVHFVPFKTRFDFGYRITCAEKDRKNKMWEQKI